MQILNTEEIVLARPDRDGVLHPLPENEARWLRIFSSHWEHNDKKGKWLFSSRGEPVGPDEKTPDAVIIVATYDPPFPHGQSGKSCLILTSEFRVPIMDREIGFPAGLMESGESAETAAKREFKEETGLELKVTYTSPPTLYSSAGLSNESIQIVFGEATGKISTEGNEGSEDIEVIVADYEYISQVVQMAVPVGAKAWPILFMLKNLHAEEQNICGFGFD